MPPLEAMLDVQQPRVHQRGEPETHPSFRLFAELWNITLCCASLQILKDKAELFFSDLLVTLNPVQGIFSGVTVCLTLVMNRLDLL